MSRDEINEQNVGVRPLQVLVYDEGLENSSLGKKDPQFTV